jgi:hypothetical protein
MGFNSAFKGLSKNGAIPLFLIWAFMACPRVNFTFLCEEVQKQKVIVNMPVEISYAYY